MFDRPIIHTYLSGYCNLNEIYMVYCCLMTVFDLDAEEDVAFGTACHSIFQNILNIVYGKLLVAEEHHKDHQIILVLYM